jgi:hypothetical protein
MRTGLFILLAFVAVPVVAAETAPVASSAPQVMTAYSTSETPIGELIDDEKAKAILERHVPGMTSNPQIDMARAFTLKDIQQYSADIVTDDVLAKIDADFKALAGVAK